MSESDWMVVETLGLPDQPTLVADGAHLRQWSSLVRARRQAGASIPGCIVQVVRRCVDSAVVEIETAPEGMRVVGVPIICAFGSVHGVQVWVGPAGRPQPPQRRVACWDWDTGTELAFHGPGLEELVFARAPDEVGVVRTPPEAFGRMVRFDGRLDYLEMAARAVPGSCWQGVVDMIGDDNRVRTFQMITRVNHGEQRMVRAIMHELSDDRTPEPALDIALVRAVSRPMGYGLGFVELLLSLIYEWTREPPPPLHRWATERPEVHPDDHAEFRTACSKVYRGSPGDLRQEIAMRVRFRGTDWIPVRAEISLIPGQHPHGLICVRHDPAG
ncbi:GAF domain-containing protein [Nocardia transvalensis]|uniref:GAF domain-containing protein n=1 Tax=Nocardia transvalensis TaxID=37333 RepID=UPI001893A41F|nr:GAF domain-containing protein [Nocardia transvalensis]MBF6330653.1 DUF5593 domain-containing protein [Nocardia transvalensis]